MLKSDWDIQQDVARELAWDTRISATDIGIQVRNGIVTLSGTIDSWAKLRAAQDAAHRVAGVLDVANDLVVKDSGRSGRTDTEIAQAIRTALEWDVTVPDQQIRSTVAHGIVTLEGVVSHGNERFDAERAIERLAGVRRVINQIEVKPSDELSLPRVREAVGRALERHAEREAGRIQVAGSAGAVSVNGVVHSWQEREAVIGAVRGTRGVSEVDDHLRLERR
jgi:osmotically-inducible protein OsmY